MWPTTAFVLTGLAAAVMIVSGARVLIRGAQSRQEFLRAMILLSNGCLLAMMASWLGVFILRLADSFLSHEVKLYGAIWTIIVAIPLVWVIGFIAAWRWKARHPTAEDYDDRGDGNAVATEPKPERASEPGA